MGFYLGFNGIIFKPNLDEIIEKIAQIKNSSLEQVAKVTTENAQELFKII